MSCRAVWGLINGTPYVKTAARLFKIQICCSLLESQAVDWSQWESGVCLIQNEMLANCEIWTQVVKSMNNVCMLARAIWHPLQQMLLLLRLSAPEVAGCEGLKPCFPPDESLEGLRWFLQVTSDPFDMNLVTGLCVMWVWFFDVGYTVCCGFSVRSDL